MILRGRGGVWILVGVFALVVLIAPFVTLIAVTPWRHFAFSPGDWAAVRVSVFYTLGALLIIVAFGTPLAWWLARARFRGQLAVEALVLLPLITPPLAMGILLASLFGPAGPAGALAGRLGWWLTNTPSAFILAQVYAAAPYYIVTARAAFEGVPREYEEIAWTLGDSLTRSFLRITLPSALLGLVAAVALAWVRALGEFGIVLIIAYFPQGIPVKLWVNLQNLGLAGVYPLLWIFFIVALPLPLVLGLLSRRGTRVPR